MLNISLNKMYLILSINQFYITIFNYLLNIITKKNKTKNIKNIMVINF